MRTRTVVATAVTLLAAAALLKAAPVSQHSYLVTVIAEDGAPVTTLNADDFIVRERNRALRVAGAEHSPFPLVVSLLVDTSKPEIIVSPARELRAALTRFVTGIRNTEKNPSIEMVEVTGGTNTVAAYDAPPDQLDAAIGRIFPAHPSDVILLEAIGAAARGMSGVQTPRRAIVTVDFNSSESATEGTMRKVMADLAQAGSTVWTVSLRLPRANTSKREAALHAMSRDSGGMRMVAGAASGLEALLGRVADSLASQYIVTFERDGDGEPGPLEMTTKQGHKVHISPMRR